MSTTLDQLKTFTEVVADTGDFQLMEKYKPEDATTNPSLVLALAKMVQYQHLVNGAIQARSAGGDSDENLEAICDCLTVAVGCAILKAVPGKVSVEVNPKCSFDTVATVNTAKSLIQMFEAEGFQRSRVLIKMATTWESCEAAKQLEKEGIHCNMTLLFGMAQAVAAAEAGSYLISPFVGRILDWYKKSTGQEYTSETDPGVISVRSVYKYYKCHGYKTIVMGASFRNTGEILALAGCDKLTISPALLEELSNSETKVEQKLSASDMSNPPAKIVMDEKTFRWMLNEDAMATEKLAEGIRNFKADREKLKTLIKDRISNPQSQSN